MLSRIFSIVLLCVALSSGLKAQDFLTPGKIYLGLSLEPFQRYEINAPVIPGIINEIGRTVRYRAGLNVKVSLTRRLCVSSGLSLLVETYSGTRDVRPRSTTSRQLLTWQLPLRFDLRLSDKKIAPVLMAGMVADFYYQGSYNATFPDNTPDTRQISDKGGYSDVHMWGILGFGAEANLGRYKIQAMPVCDMTTSTFMDSDISLLPGFMISVAYRL